MRSRSWFWRMSGLSILLTLIAGLFLLKAVSLNGLPSLQSEFIGFRSTLVAARLTMIFTLIAFWPALVEWVANHRRLSTASVDALQSARWRCLAWFVSLELLIGLNGLEAVVMTAKAIAS